jgi:hypothetical protein
MLPRGFPGAAFSAWWERFTAGVPLRILVSGNLKNTTEVLKRMLFMRNKGSHTLTTKKRLAKSKVIFYAYNDIQLRYGEELDRRSDILEMKCNVPIDCELKGTYTTDFYCIKSDGSIMVRECVFLSKLSKPKTCSMLDASRNYWLSRGVQDWGIVLDGK